MSAVSTRDWRARALAAEAELSALRATASGAETGWQTMDSAPKEMGASVILAVRTYEGRWIVGEADWIADDSEEDGAWWWANTHGAYHADKIIVSHGHPVGWQPIPAPPEAAAPPPPDAPAPDAPPSGAERALRELLAAAKMVLSGLEARIEAAVAAGGQAVPVFWGIADLHDEIGHAESALRSPAGARPVGEAE